MTLEPWQIEFPLPIATDRVTLRPCREGDGTALAQAIDESFDALHPWFHDSMGPRETEVSPKWQEVVACRSLAQFKARERLQFLVWTTSETLVGSVELFDPDWGTANQTEGLCDGFTELKLPTGRRRFVVSATVVFERNCAVTIGVGIRAYPPVFSQSSR